MLIQFAHRKAITALELFRSHHCARATVINRCVVTLWHPAQFNLAADVSHGYSSPQTRHVQHVEQRQICLPAGTGVSQSKHATRPARSTTRLFACRQRDPISRSRKYSRICSTVTWHIGSASNGKVAFIQKSSAATFSRLRSRPD